MNPRNNRPNTLLSVRPFERTSHEGHDIESAFLLFDDHLGRRVELFAARCLPLPDRHPGVEKFPVILHAPGGGQTVDPRDLSYYARLGFASASFDWQIQGAEKRDPVRRTRFPDTVVAQHAHVESTDNLVFPVAILGAGVVIDWLAQHPGFDTRRVGMAGISWGGYLTWLVNAYEPRIKAAVPVYGCGGLFEPDHPYPRSVTNAAREYWRTHFDALNLTHKQKSPVCYLSSTNDFFGANSHADRVLNLLKVPHRRSSVPNGGHYLTAAESATGIAWFKHHLDAGPPLPAEPTLSQKLVVTADESQPIERTQVWHTASDCLDHYKCWHSGKPARLAGVRQAFARVFYASGVVLNSPLVFFDSPDARPKPRAKPPAAWRSVDGLSPHPGLTSTQFWRTDFAATRLENRASADDIDLLWVIDRDAYRPRALTLSFFGLSDPRWNDRPFDSLEFTLDFFHPGQATLEAALTLHNGKVFAAPAAIERIKPAKTNPCRVGVRLSQFADLPAGTTWSNVGRVELRGMMPGNRVLIRRIEKA